METAIADYLRSSVSNIDHLYSWKFDEVLAGKRTGGGAMFSGSSYKKTLALKFALQDQLRDCDDSGKHLEIARYIVTDWGGVKTNKDLENLVNWTRQKAAIGRAAFDNVPLKGVSSWSKYLSLLCDWALIYDSRVAFSINAINYMSGNCEKFFPMPDGRNSRLNLIDLETLFITSRLKSCANLITEEDSRHRDVAKRVQKKFHVPADKAYSAYIELIDGVVCKLDDELKECNGNRHTVEMLLFSMAPEKIWNDLVKCIQRAPS